MRNTLRNSVTRIDRIGKRKYHKRLRVQFVTRDLVHRLDNDIPGPGSRRSPSAAECRTIKKIECKVAIALLCGLFGDTDQVRDRACVRGYSVVEDFAQPGHPRDVIGC